MLFGATSHYMQTLHVDCNHLKMTNYGMHETNRYGAMNVTGVFFLKLCIPKSYFHRIIYKRSSFKQMQC